MPDPRNPDKFIQLVASVVKTNSLHDSSDSGIVKLPWIERMMKFPFTEEIREPCRLRDADCRPSRKLSHVKSS